MDRIFVCQRCGKKLDLHPSLTEINFEELEKDKDIDLEVALQKVSNTNFDVIPSDAIYKDDAQKQVLSKSVLSSPTPTPGSHSPAMTSPRLPTTRGGSPSSDFVIINDTSKTKSDKGYSTVKTKTKRRIGLPGRSKKVNASIDVQAMEANTNGHDVLVPDSDAVSIEPLVSKLLDLATAEIAVDLPLCVECARFRLDDINKSILDAKQEVAAYQEFLLKLEAEEKQAADCDFSEEVAQLKHQEKELKKELEDILKQREKTKKKLNRLRREHMTYQELEEKYWCEHGKLRLDQELFVEERHSVRQVTKSALLQLEQRRREHILTDAFHIWYEGHFGTINGLRMGRLPSTPVDWSEINAGWGFAAQALVSIAEFLNFEFKTYKILPFGSQTKFEKPGSDTSYELFGERDLSLVRLFWYRRFDNGMVAFLECLTELAAHIQTRDKNFRLPYKVEGDKLENVSIKLQYSSEENWTKALKYTLTNLKALVVWTIQQDNDATL